MKIFNGLKNFVTFALAVSSLLVVSATSQAAIVAADLAPITTSVTSDIGVVVPWAFTLLGLILAAIIGFTLVKKFANKSAG